MQITMKDIIDEGFEIIEEVFGANVETPVDLYDIQDMSLDSFEEGSYDVKMDEQKIYTDNSDTLFSVYLKGENVLLSTSMSKVKSFFKIYFAFKELNWNLKHLDRAWK